MKVREAKALEREFNEILERGRAVWQEAQTLASRCNEIRETLDRNNVAYDQIALLFGAELQIDVVGNDEDEIK